jgi:hypothetical protein
MQRQANNFSTGERKAQVELTTRSGEVYPVPFSRLDPRPTSTNRICDAYVDRELANEAVTYALESGAEGVVHIEQALEYNQDPAYFADLLVQQLTAEEALPWQLFFHISKATAAMSKASRSANAMYALN